MDETVPTFGVVVSFSMKCSQDSFRLQTNQRKILSQISKEVMLFTAKTYNNLQKIHPNQTTNQQQSLLIILHDLDYV